MKTTALVTDTPHSLPLRLRQAAAGLGVAVTAVGALVLIGWALDISLLKQMVAGLATMKPNTALCFLLSGAALLLLNKEDVEDWQRYVALGCAAVVVLIPLLTLAEYLFNLNLGLDELMFREGPNPIATSYPGRMGIHTAFSLLFAGLALLLLDAKSQRKQWIGQTMALAVMLIGLLVLVAYLYGAAFFPHIFSHTSMAIHTALTFIALGLGLLAARPRQGLMSLAISAGPGGVMLRRLLPASVIILIVFGWLGLVGERAGLYDTPLGTALEISLGIVVFTLLLGWNARVMERADAELRATGERLRVTLSSIGDAVIATDTTGRISFMNPVAESLTGWGSDEAFGQELPEVFRIVNEQTRATVENPLTRVIRDGVVVGLANHTVLIARDGTERPIEDSGAPIRNAARQTVGAVLVFHDVTEARQADEALRQSQQELIDFVENATVGLHWVGPDGIILWANRADRESLGYAQEEYIGHHIAEFHADQEVINDILERLARNETLDNYEARLRCKDGSTRHVLINSNVRWEGDKFIHTRCFTRDITDRRQAEAEREEALKREQKARRLAEEASRFKDEFLAVVSHELRAPLNAINGYAHLLSNGKLDDEATRHAVETIQRSAKAQARLIEDLLDTSRIITGKLRLNAIRTDLLKVIEAALDTARPAAEAKGIAIKTSFDPEAVRIVGDPMRLQQVIWNLVSNAVKFTPKGGRVDVALNRENSRVEIVVSDTGEGIKQEFLPFVFDRFRQADSSSQRTHGGLGLGLAIVRHLVEMHGGTVSAHSEGAGLGARFSILLPIRAVVRETEVETKEYSQEEQTIQAQVDLQGVRVLVVDDEADARAMLTTVLNQSGAEVRACASVEEAIEELPRFKPHVLISDVGMPQADGYTLLKQVRALGAERGGNVPAIALTAFARSEDRKRAFAAGYQTHIPKPVEPLELILTVASFTNRRGKNSGDEQSSVDGPSIAQ